MFNKNIFYSRVVEEHKRKTSSFGKRTKRTVSNGLMFDYTEYMTLKEV